MSGLSLTLFALVGLLFCGYALALHSAKEYVASAVMFVALALLLGTAYLAVAMDARQAQPTEVQTLRGLT